jgi:hypothetical protein
MSARRGVIHQQNPLHLPPSLIHSFISSPSLSLYQARTRKSPITRERMGWREGRRKRRRKGREASAPSQEPLHHPYSNP